AARSWVPMALARAARPDDLTNVLRPLVASWRPSGTTALTLEGDTLKATPVAGGTSVALATVSLSCCPGPIRQWSMRADGGAFVASVEVGYMTARLAIWEPSTGAVRWLTPAEPRVRHLVPVWSPEGTAIHFGRCCANYEERG